LATNRSFSVCKVWDAEYPWDVRVEKISRSLREAGHAVHLAARNRTGLPVLEELAEATVYRMPVWSWAPRAINSASMFPAFFNPRWIRLIRRVVVRGGADVILCRDLPLAVPCIVVGRAYHIPVVLDMAENYPAMIRALWSARRARPLDVLMRNPMAVRLIEDWVLRRVDGVMVVVEESAARLVARGVPADAIAIVGNTPPIARLRADPARHGDGGQPLRLVYLGLLEVPRGVGTLLEAVARLAERRVPVQLTVIGDGRDAALLHGQAVSLGLHEPMVTFRGRLPNRVAIQELQKADVGIIPHWKNESWDTTIPNKLFDYMAAGLPVITSNTVPAARIVGTAQSGLAFQDRDPLDLAAKTEQLLSADVRRRMADRGRSAIRTTFHWERDVERMLALLDRFVTRSTRTPAASAG
jgi:glycosyltransferase involved in cell wall biosynthesis